VSTAKKEEDLRGKATAKGLSNLERKQFLQKGVRNAQTISQGIHYIAHNANFLVA
jgi:hypothetical protein